mgnify:CR=1 FL=1
MTTQQLNRDIKRLAATVKKHKQNGETLQKEEEIRKELNRLYYADTTLEAASKNSLMILIRLNLRFRAIPLHIFGLDIEY